MTATLIGLAILLALGCLGNIWFAVGSDMAANRARRALRLAEHRAALAETALAQLRARRSDAVSRGNRTRAEQQAALRAETLAGMKEKIALRDTPQRDLPLGDDAA